MKTAAIVTSATVLWLTIAASGPAAEMAPQAFAEKTAQTDMFEMEAAKLVLEKGKSDEVKAFAGDMVKDHGHSAHNLREAAAKDGVTLPPDLSPEMREKLESLKPLSGPQLDAAYVSTQVSVHTEAVELFDKYSKDGEGGALKSFAMATYPTIRMHLIRVRSFNVEQ
jgi:putative membrane protein